MKIFDRMMEHDYEQVIFCQDKDTGLKAIICIHDTTLGPALGGCRILDYKSEDEALNDVLRLARGMTYKNAAAGLDLGGGKSVILGDPDTIKSEALFRVFGRFVEGLNGRYLTAEDVNSTTADMDFVNLETENVVGIEHKSGNPAPVTAYGTFRGIQAAANEVYGSDDLKGKVVAIQGVGSVGYYLSELLVNAGAKLIVTDIKKASIDRVVNEFGAESVAPDKIYGVECDIFSPCAMGAIINDFTVEELKCKIVAGSANNQLAENVHGDILDKKGILYVPDYVINSGGAINVAQEMKGYDKDRAMANTSLIYDACKRVFEIAKEDKIPTYRAADKMAEERINSLVAVKRILPHK
ncbi:Glu/Leu/Phe/Val family dehydrogenase [Microaceticoccus formicicus]|uniref:Glu/Leu/Phe/Val family dehydrogenase n=1 Tax=Microaceticoccus formicicus TaxID=3118105 RepID=UPI003CCFFF55|nr:Glu/Leu/Phe/Val dehydrogenase [Peptoniphilaceae bacterium AMB_02]